jgi:hypothetical protein
MVAWRSTSDAESRDRLIKDLVLAGRGDGFLSWNKFTSADVTGDPNFSLAAGIFNFLPLAEGLLTNLVELPGAYIFSFAVGFFFGDFSSSRSKA